MKSSPSRLLNEKVNFFGLSIWDIAGIGYSLILFNSFLEKFGFELLAFPIVGVLAWLLVQVRLKYRPKVIRDFIKHNLIIRFRPLNREV